MDELEIRKKRALYRANHRGTKELDIMLGRFAEARLAEMSNREFAAFEELLALQDPEIDQILRGAASAPENVAAITADIRKFLKLLD